MNESVDALICRDKWKLTPLKVKIDGRSWSVDTLIDLPAPVICERKSGIWFVQWMLWFVSHHSGRKFPWYVQMISDIIIISLDRSFSLTEFINRVIFVPIKAGRLVGNLLKFVVRWRPEKMKRRLHLRVIILSALHCNDDNDAEDKDMLVMEVVMVLTN